MTCCVVHAVCNVGALWSWRLARILWLMGPPGIRFNDNVDSGVEGRMSKKSMSLSPLRTRYERSPKVEEGSGRTATATRSAQKRAHFCLLVLHLSGRGNCPGVHAGRLPLKGCSFKGKHVLNDRAAPPVVFEESVKLEVTWKHQRKSRLLPHQGQTGTTGSLMTAMMKMVDWREERICPRVCAVLTDGCFLRREGEHGPNDSELCQ